MQRNGTHRFVKVEVAALLPVFLYALDVRPLALFARLTGQPAHALAVAAAELQP